MVSRTQIAHTKSSTLPHTPLHYRIHRRRHSCRSIRLSQALASGLPARDAVATSLPRCLVASNSSFPLPPYLGGMKTMEDGPVGAHQHHLHALGEEDGMSDQAIGLLLAVGSSIFIGASFIVKKKGLQKAGSTGLRAGKRCKGGTETCGCVEKTTTRLSRTTHAQVWAATRTWHNPCGGPA